MDGKHYVKMKNNEETLEFLKQTLSSPMRNLSDEEIQKGIEECMNSNLELYNQTIFLGKRLYALRSESGLDFLAEVKYFDLL